MRRARSAAMTVGCKRKPTDVALAQCHIFISAGARSDQSPTRAATSSIWLGVAGATAPWRASRNA